MTEQTAASAPSAVPVAAAKPPAPTEFPPAVRKTIEWLSTAYAHWYSQNPPPLPHRFAKREFGFMMWPERPGPPPFFRHKAFPHAEGLRDYLSRAGPHSVYYSTAYYNRPGEMKMADKQWLGAELIFDLDADHLQKVEDDKAKGVETPLEVQLALVKEQFKRLLDEFLFGDFGLGEQDVWITFSGGRGYHAHVVEERLMQLESKGRREIVDYITGKFPVDREGEVQLGQVRTVLAGTDGRGKFAKGLYQVEVPTAAAPGWGGRLTRRVVQLLDENVSSATRPAALKWLQQFEGVGAKRAERFLEKYSEQVRARLVGAQRESAGYSLDLERFRAADRAVLSAENSILEKVYVTAAQQMGIRFEKGETDEPVTADTKRLIRLPGSLHGKSGLRVVTLTRSQLDEFDPLRDAVAFGTDPVRILPRKDATATLGGETVSVKGGEAVEVPERHAIFWLARQGGTIAPA